MKVVLLAGGLGTRISEESYLKPKPMIEIGGMPILWHIMKVYHSYGFNEFIICCGYKGYAIKEFFNNYALQNSDITFDFSNGNKTVIHNDFSEQWKVTLVDTGLHTMTGGRIKRIKPYIDAGDTFMLTYGDGVSDVNIKELAKYHKNHNKYATVTTVRPSGKFGAIQIENGEMVKSFEEKPLGDGSWINGGFFVLDYKVFDYIEDDSTIFEKRPLETLAAENQLMAFKHNGFWQPMDTKRDKDQLESVWESGKAAWKVWK